VSTVGAVRPKRRGGVGIAVALGSALLVLGCGQSVVTNTPTSAASPSSATVPGASLEASNACLLVPDMDTLVGKTALVAPAEYQIGPLSRCTWVYGRDPTRSVGVNFGPVAGHADSITSFGQGEAVPALGDDARWWPGARTLSVSVGPRSFQVNLELDPADVSKELAVSIARSALTRTP
jgi:hypothetical protein